MKQNNISNNDKFYRIQDGGKIYEAIIDNEIYKFNYYKTKDNDVINIFITSKDKDTIFITVLVKHFVSLLLLNKNNIQQKSPKLIKFSLSIPFIISINE